jgi:hypothetical protein
MKNNLLEEYLNFLNEQDKPKTSKKKPVDKKRKFKISDFWRNQALGLSDDIPPALVNLVKNKNSVRAAEEIL